MTVIEHKTGWPAPLLMQDDNRALSLWFSTRLGALYIYKQQLKDYKMTMPKYHRFMLTIPLDGKYPDEPLTIGTLDTRLLDHKYYWSKQIKKIESSIISGFYITSGSIVFGELSPENEPTADDLYDEYFMFYYHLQKHIFPELKVNISFESYTDEASWALEEEPIYDCFYPVDHNTQLKGE